MEIKSAQRDNHDITLVHNLTPAFAALLSQINVNDLRTDQPPSPAPAGSGQEVTALLGANHTDHTDHTDGH